MTTANVDVSAFRNDEVFFSFDSSWRPESYDDGHEGLGGRNENNQTALVYVSFDGAAPLKVDFWDSDTGNLGKNETPQRGQSAFYKGDATNEHLEYALFVPDGATNAQFTFGYINAANDWWWAVDNLELANSSNVKFWGEDFDGPGAVTLSDSVNERVRFGYPKVTAANDDPNTTPVPNAFTHTPPTGWSVDNSGAAPGAGIPAAAIGDNNIGSFEWEGWSFTNHDFAIFGSQTSLGGFTKASGNFAIADSDEFDDFGGGDGITKPYGTVLESPTLDISGMAPNTLALQFDSAWQYEDAQTAIITVDYGNGEIEVLHWTSNDADLEHFHGDNTNESVFIELDNPAGATSAKVRFKYLNGNDDYFWAIDNVQIGAAAVPEPASLALAAAAGLALTSLRRRRS